MEATGSMRKASAPESSRAAVSSEEATGRRMNGAEIFIGVYSIVRSARSARWRGRNVPLVAGLRRLHSALNRLRSTKAAGQTIEPDVHDRRGVKSEQLADQQSSDNADAQRLTQLGTGSGAYGQRQSSKQSGRGGHHDGPEAQ